MYMKTFVIFLIFLFGTLQPSFSQDGSDNLRLSDFLDTTDLTLSGSAKVESNGSLTLTPSEFWLAGSVFSSKRISTNKFSTYFSFRISDPGNGGADGIALVAQNVSASLGDVGGGMGYDGVGDSLAIEFDTYQNAWDVDANHTGLLINGDVKHQNFPAVRIRQSFEDGRPWHVWIDYDGKTMSLRMARERQRPDSPIFEHSIDIRNLLDSDVAFVGFASATGASRAHHQILEWTYLERFAPNDFNEVQNIATDLSKERRVELTVEFDFDSDKITPEGYQKVSQFAQAINQLYEDVPTLTIFGHTDSVGTETYNLTLSDNRAKAVMKTLIQRHGFPSQRLTALGLGESELKFPAQPEAAGNRRVEIRVF